MTMAGGAACSVLAFSVIAFSYGPAAGEAEGPPMPEIRPTDLAPQSGPLSNWQVVYQECPEQLPASGPVSCMASCPSPTTQVVLGGGAFAGGPDVRLVGSWPISSSQWMSWWFTESGGAGKTYDLFTYALCATPSP